MTDTEERGRPEKTNKKQEKKTQVTIPANKKGRHINRWLDLFRLFVIPAYWLAYPFRFYGHKKVEDGPFLYICNHYRGMDLVYPCCTTSESVRFLAKKEVLKPFFTGWTAKKIRIIPVSRDGKDVRGLMDCLKCLKNGEKVVLYPESTRNRTDAPLLPFKSGAALIAIKAQVPVLPIMIYQKPRHFRLNHILVGEPFELSEYYGKKLTDELLKEADEKLMRVMLDLRAEHEQFLLSKKRKRNKTTDSVDK